MKKKKSILAIQMGCRQLTYYSETADNKGIHTTLKIIWKNCTGHYTYDIHGNVDTLLQDNQQLSLISTALQPQRFKKIIYDYDLISGNVNLVSYQDGEPDAFYHFYEYDADNRIIAVYSSNYPQKNALININTVANSPLWDNDAKYFYYAHGPLARVEYGDNKAQGMDYAYTLQGWIKGVNSNTLDTLRDIGKDGAIGSVNSIFAKDAFGYTLNYHTNDYKAIDGLKWNTATNRFESIIAGSDLNNSRNDLFNGNITSMVTTLEKPMIYTGAVNETPTVMAQGTAYKYDQLNRLKEMKAFANLDFTTNTWQSGSTYSGMYHNRFNFDANGNIQWQQRADSTGSIFDKLSYRYKLDPTGRLAQNRLYHVNDSAANNLATDDIKDEGVFTANASTINSANNYEYDEIGNLKHDSQEQIDSITWTVYGKIKKIIRTTTSSKPDLEFNYDASGNRIAKIVKPHGTSVDNGGTDIPTQWTTTYYVRDAQGNIMTTYKLAAPAMASSFKVIERNIFGNSRLGSEDSQIELIAALPTANPYTRTLGNKHYEASNHLGNVLTVFTDRKIPVTSDNTTIDHFDADVVNTYDYSPFGAPMNERTYRLAHVFTDTTHTDTVWAYVNGNTPLNLIADDSTKYRYGFNNQEKDDEIYGNGNATTAEYWEYDTRLGKRWDTDPITQEDQSPYDCFDDNPVLKSDENGDGTGEASVIFFVTQEVSAAAAASVVLAPAVPLIEAVGSIWALTELLEDVPAIPPPAKDKTVPAQAKPKVEVKNAQSTKVKANSKAAASEQKSKTTTQTKANSGKTPKIEKPKEKKPTPKDKPKKTNQTYTKKNEKTGEVYSGRTSGTGTPEQNVSNRDANHHMNEQGFGPAKLDESSPNPDAIRGREQQLIEENGGAQSQEGTSGNKINGISPKNKNAAKYREAAKKEFNK